jgi:hypothetical protein
MNSEMVDEIGYYTSIAKGIAWDTCHKIYILLDDEQMRLMADYEYDPLISSAEMTPAEMTAQVVEWFQNSCGLRFVNAVETNTADPNAGFTDVIPQGWTDPDDIEECRNCLLTSEDTDVWDGLCAGCHEEASALV